MATGTFPSPPFYDDTLYVVAGTFPAVSSDLHDAWCIPGIYELASFLSGKRKFVEFYEYRAYLFMRL